MEKRFSFGVAILLMLSAAFLPGLILIGLFVTFHWKMPNWIASLVGLFSLYFAVEVASHYGPKKFATLATTVRKYAQPRDRVILIIGLTVALVIVFFPVSQGYKSIWSSLVFLVAALCSFYSICALFGTSELRQDLAPASLKSLLAREKASEDKS